MKYICLKINFDKEKSKSFSGPSTGKYEPDLLPIWIVCVKSVQIRSYF